MPELDAGATDALIRTLQPHYKLVHFALNRLGRLPHFRATIEAAVHQGQDPALTETLLIAYHAAHLFQRSSLQKRAYAAARCGPAATLHRAQLSLRGVSRFQARIVLGYCVLSGAVSLSRHVLRPLVPAFAPIQRDQITDEDAANAWLSNWINILHVRLANMRLRHAVADARLNDVAQRELIHVDAILRRKARPGITVIRPAPGIRIARCLPTHRNLELYDFERTMEIVRFLTNSMSFGRKNVHRRTYYSNLLCIYFSAVGLTRTPS